MNACSKVSSLLQKVYTPWRRKFIIDSSDAPRGGVAVVLADADRISRLPDDVLHRILRLLFLSTIAKTSFLSWRWAQIWHSFPDLDFTTVRTSEDNLDMFVKYFRHRAAELRREARDIGNLLLIDVRKGNGDWWDFITNVLLSRSGGSDLRAPRFRAYISRPAAWLSNLIKLALSLNVCELDVEFPSNKNFHVPEGVFSGKSLRVLRFQSHFASLWLPPLKCGSRSLQVIELRNVQFVGKNDVFRDEWFPKLKKLSITQCYWLRSRGVNCQRGAATCKPVEFRS